MARRFNPLQARDTHGRWVAKAGNAAFNAATKKVGSGRKSPLTVKTVKGRGRAPLSLSESLSELGRNTVPYVRVNKRSQTIGINAGTRIPGTHKRVVFGTYSRLESTRNKTAVDRFAAKGVSKVFPEGTRRGKAVSAIRKNVAITNPAIRATVRGHQVRLGTSRGAGPTIIVRRGKHKTSQSKSVAGITKYDTQMRKVSGKRASTKVKRARPQRRTAARKKK